MGWRQLPRADPLADRQMGPDRQEGENRTQLEDGVDFPQKDNESMTNRQLHDVLAEAFVAEGVDTHFTLLGDANMHWGTVLAEQHNVTTVHARHEHCACAMASAYAYV